MAPIRGAAVCLAAVGAWNLLSQAFVAPRPITSSRTSRVAMQAAENTGGGGYSSGPLLVYMNALMDAASKKSESVPVTKDVMRYKNLMEGMDEDMKFEMTAKLNVPGISILEEADTIVSSMGPWESTVFPKFITFMAKKRRLKQLKPLCQEYVQHLYARESIEPVTVFSAAPLTDEQVDKIKAKMAAKLQVRDIKLIQKIDMGLLSGFKIEWGYTDPENPSVGAESIDLSLKSALEDAAVTAGR
jgi:F-type H+-transporting ATPase subunit delta